jgi:hypothetical protein
MAKDWVDKIADIMKEQFSLKQKEHTGVYWRLYSEWFNTVSLPPQYIVPDFRKFSDSDNIPTIEHINWYFA